MNSPNYPPPGGPQGPGPYGPPQGQPYGQRPQQTPLRQRDASVNPRGIAHDARSESRSTTGSRRRLSPICLAHQESD